MKTLIIFLCLVFQTMAFADDINLAWDASDKATSYKVYQSTDNGATWDSGTDVGNVLQYTATGVSSSGLVLFKVSAINDKGETINSWSGAWYNGDWKPPDAAKGLGIK